MEAIVYEEFGGPEVLRLTRVDDVHPGPGQIRVAVRAAGVNPVDHKIRNGWMEAAFPTPLPATPGSEFAGVVDETGEGVTGPAVGDEVLGRSVTGAYAAYVLADADAVAPRPEGLGWEEAAALPVATATAARVLDELAVTAGDTLLLHGAAGAVGSAAVQLATARGATVVGTASPANHDYLRVLGAVPVAYGEGLVERVRAAAPQGVDAVFDAAGKGRWPTRSSCVAEPTASSPSPTRTHRSTAWPSRRAEARPWTRANGSRSTRPWPRSASCGSRSRRRSRSGTRRGPRN